MVIIDTVWMTSVRIEEKHWQKNGFVFQFKVAAWVELRQCRL